MLKTNNTSQLIEVIKSSLIELGYDEFSNIIDLRLRKRGVIIGVKGKIRRASLNKEMIKAERKLRKYGFKQDALGHFVDKNNLVEVFFNTLGRSALATIRPYSGP